MTRDEAKQRLMNTGMMEEWAEGWIKALTALDVLQFDKQKPQDKAMEAYEEAMQAAEVMDKIQP